MPQNTRRKSFVGTDATTAYGETFQRQISRLNDEPANYYQLTLQGFFANEGTVVFHFLGISCYYVLCSHEPRHSVHTVTDTCAARYQPMLSQSVSERVG